MRIVIQRVSQAEVKVEGNSVGSIEKGLLVLLGIENNDDQSDLEWLVNNMTTFMGSEAQFTLAQIHFNQENLSAAKSEIDQLLKMKPSYDFWIAKGLILKSRILIKEGDLFQSEQNLKAVMEHYPNTDDGILEEANALWDDIMILKNPPIDETEDDNETKIEIDED